MARIIKSDAAPRAAPNVRTPQVVGVGKKVVAKEVFSAGNKAELILARAQTAAAARAVRAQEQAEAHAARSREIQSRASQVGALADICAAYHRRGTTLAQARDQALSVANTMVFKITGKRLELPPEVTLPMVDAALRERRGRVKVELDLTEEEVAQLYEVPGLERTLAETPELCVVANGGGVVRTTSGEMPVDLKMVAQALCHVVGLEVPEDLQDQPPPPLEDDPPIAFDDALEDAQEAELANRVDAEADESVAEEEEPEEEQEAQQEPRQTDGPSLEIALDDSAWVEEESADTGSEVQAEAWEEDAAPEDEGFQDSEPEEEEPAEEVLSDEEEQATGELAVPEVSVVRQNPLRNPPRAEDFDDQSTASDTQQRELAQAAIKTSTRVQVPRMAETPPPRGPEPRAEGTRVEALPPVPRISDEPSASRRVRPLPPLGPQDRTATRAPTLPAPQARVEATMAVPRAVLEQLRNAPEAHRRPPPMPGSSSTRVEIRHARPADPPKKR